jgi:hypothetical protein
MVWAVLTLLACILSACSPQVTELLSPLGDIRPPEILSAGQEEQGSFEIRFNETVEAVARSFSMMPSSTRVTPRAEGSLLRLDLEPGPGAGVPCSIAGEAKDAAGNVTRFLFSFTGFNPRPAKLEINEVQTGKNNAASNRHRDYVEFVALSGGNLGGLQFQWASSVKVLSYVFPPCEVPAGAVIVLHLAPESIPAEVDETGGALGLSGGIDASETGRDLWCSEGGLPDETGFLLLRTKEGGPAMDCLFYAALDKEGTVDSDRLGPLFTLAAAGGLWPFNADPRWEDALRWKASSSRPLHRKKESGNGADFWYVGDSGSQSPGLEAPAAKRLRP